ncbi:uncharacterized protein LOC121972552 [Zingiber officinale]|uniref:Uncharacterized protein n=1 Tax=Zingiber officinale TaxID=94328 RepID=A0A8J5HP20_ZINOF|nr:uncharacterized protein LOC121972552 [Zingiber officinale]KAG6532878.1 hypothetical protein ZIOFF_006737 [Zingiber officinale]
MLTQRLRRSGIFRTVSPRIWGRGEGSASHPMVLPDLKRKVSNTWSAVQETYLSTKNVFETHRVVFTIGTSIASVLTAWAGYSLRQIHQSNIEKRLESMEQALKKSYSVDHEEIKKIANSGNVSSAAFIATAGTSLIVGYGLGWRGGQWYANRKFRREQLKLMGQLKPQRWQLLRKSFGNFRRTPASKIAEIPGIANVGSLHPNK